MTKKILMTKVLVVNLEVSPTKKGINDESTVKKYLK